jgi:hypothetical protein
MYHHLCDRTWCPYEWLLRHIIKSFTTLVRLTTACFIVTLSGLSAWSIGTHWSCFDGEFNSSCSWINLDTDVDTWHALPPALHLSFGWKSLTALVRLTEACCVVTLSGLSAWSTDTHWSCFDGEFSSYCSSWLNWIVTLTHDSRRHLLNIWVLDEKLWLCWCGWRWLVALLGVLGMEHRYPLIMFWWRLQFFLFFFIYNLLWKRSIHQFVSVGFCGFVYKSGWMDVSRLCLWTKPTYRAKVYVSMVGSGKHI